MDESESVIRETLFTKIYRACKEWRQWQGRGQFFEWMDLVRHMMLLTIENEWQVGCGPGGLPYSSFQEEDFWFDF